MTAAVITVSDSAFHKTRKDESGPAVRTFLEARGFRVVWTETVADERIHIENTLLEACAKAQLVVSTGGTGMAVRDVTPEATESIADRLVPGLAERIRHEGARKTPFTALSRGICATRGTSLIINVPGSPTAAVESLETVIDLLPHALDLLQGKTSHDNTRKAL